MIAAISILSFLGTVAIVGAKVAFAGSALKTVGNFLDVSNIGQFKNFDQPVTDLIGQCCLLMARFMDMISILVVLCSFLCIIFNAFKLWSGTTEVKKAFVDMVLKCTIVSVLTLVWPSVVFGTYNLATSIGIEASGGQELIVSSFAQVAKNTSEVVNKTTAEFVNIVKNGFTKDSDGMYKISQNLLDGFASTLSLTPQEAENYLESKGIKVGNTQFEKIQIDGAKGFWIFSNEQKKQQDKYNRQVKKANKNINKNENNAYNNLNNSLNDGANANTLDNNFLYGQDYDDYIKQNFIVLRSLSEILTGVPTNELGNADMSYILNLSQESLDSIFYNPFVDGTNRLSISTMIKTAIVFSKAFADGSLAPFDNLYDYSEEDMESVFSVVQSSQDLTLILKLVGGICKWVVYHLGMILCVLFLMIEYSLTLIEFLLVGAVSCLLIPFYFIDATKQFVTNFIRMILSYFIKIMVTTMMVFFVMGMYLRMANSMYTRVLADTATVLYYVFILMLGLILSKSAGKVASAVISGNPSLGFGDVAHQMRGMGHIMHSTMRSMEHAARDMKDVMNKGKGAVHDGAVLHEANKASLDGASVAENSTRNSLTNQRDTANKLQNKLDRGETLTAQENELLNASHGFLDMSDKDIERMSKKAGEDYYNDSMSQFNKGWMYNKLTGLEKPVQEDGALRVGQQIVDPETKAIRTASLYDVQNAGKLSGEKAASEVVKKAGEQYGRRLPSKQPNKRKVDLPEIGQ